jgi:hypothetical protein
LKKRTKKLLRSVPVAAFPANASMVVEPLGRKSLFTSFSSEKEDSETFKAALAIDPGQRPSKCGRRLTSG